MTDKPQKWYLISEDDKNKIFRAYDLLSGIRSHPLPADENTTLDKLLLLEEWDYYNNRNFLTPHPTFHDMIRLVREKPDEARKHIEQLRKAGEQK